MHTEDEDEDEILDNKQLREKKQEHQEKTNGCLMAVLWERDRMLATIAQKEVDFQEGSSARGVGGGPYFSTYTKE